jgi:hypothetical protein
MARALDQEDQVTSLKDCAYEILWVALGVCGTIAFSLHDLNWTVTALWAVSTLCWTALLVRALMNLHGRPG